MPGNAWMIADGTAEPYQLAVETELSRLIAEKQRLNLDEVYRPNPSANCRFCDFKSLCPLFPEGQEIFPVEAAT
jgi:hypothetical protein